MCTVRTPGILFDLDDTLLDHRGAARSALATWCPDLALAGTLDEWDRQWLALETEFYRRFQARELTNTEQRRARVRAFLPHLDLDLDSDADAAYAAYWRAYEAAWRPFPDAVPTLRRATRAGLAVGVLTNGEAQLQRGKVAATDLARFDLPVIASSELPAAKPDPSAFTAACDRIGLRPEQCTMVGDVLETDVLGARAAGLSAVLLDRSARYDDPVGPCVTSLGELVLVGPTPAGR